jgi:hypothetical protein
MYNNKSLAKLLKSLTPNNIGVKKEFSDLPDKLYPGQDLEQKLSEIKIRSSNWIA